MAITPSPETVSDLVDRWEGFYREAHRYAELSHREFETTDRIEKALDTLEVEHFRVTETGTVGVLRNGAGPTIAFRADIDGLPIEEATGFDYACTDRGELDGHDVGTMHGCGHDTHFSSLLAAVDHLIANRSDWAGTVVLLFQPAEEVGSGADVMVQGGVWDKVPRPEVVLGQHVMPLRGGQVALRPENAMCLADSLRVVVTGKQAHGSQPHLSIDPVVATASMITRLQTVVSREVEPGIPAVVTVGMLRAGSAPNIIPEKAEFSMNIRTPEQVVRNQVLDAVHRILESEAAAARVGIEISQLNSFPRCYNDPEQTDRVTGVLRSAFGDDAVHVPPAPLTGSEDVGALADAIEVPLVFWFFGGFADTAFDDGATPPGNHSPRFAPDARIALTTGITAAICTLSSYLAADDRG